jgi:signal transduction histidine kinase
MTVFNATDRRRYERELVDARAAAEAASTALRDLNAGLEQRIAAAVDERMKVEEALRQSHKMEAVGQLTGGVAHDFNNLLTIIIGGLDSIGRQIDRLPESDELARVRRSRAMALHGAERAAALTARLLAFSRQRALDPKPLDPNRLISGLADLLQRTLGETIALETVSGAGLWRAFADPTELENVLINLAVNARDAMPNGGRLTIETGNASLDEAYVEALTEPVASGQYVLIAVSDTGYGMDEKTLAQVFEPFFTTKEAGKGTGLGLSQVYGFVRQTGGHVRIYSEVGEGTTVKLYLPRASADAPEREGAERLLSLPTEGGPETILVVEDHEELRAFSTGVLRELGYNVVEASSGRVALEVLQTSSDFDLLFTDVVLPDGMSGRELADEAVRRRPGLKVLFTTGYTRNAIVHNGKLDPGVNLISKPFTYEQLAAKVRALLD